MHTVALQVNTGMYIKVGCYGFYPFFSFSFFYSLIHANLVQGEAKTMTICIRCCHDNVKSHRVMSCQSGLCLMRGHLPRYSEALWRAPAAHVSGGGGGPGTGCCRRACGGHTGRGSSGCPSGTRCRGSTCTGTASGLQEGRTDKTDFIFGQLYLILILVITELNLYILVQKAVWEDQIHFRAHFRCECCESTHKKLSELMDSAAPW